MTQGPLTDEELAELERRNAEALADLEDFSDRISPPTLARLLSEVRALRELRELARRVITEPVGIATAPSNGYALRAMLDKLTEMHLAEHP